MGADRRAVGGDHPAAFFTSVYVPAAAEPVPGGEVGRHGRGASPATGSRSGVGIGWCGEEFELLEQSFRTRGRRTDEGLALMGALGAGVDGVRRRVLRRAAAGHGPTPTAPIPIYVGGLSEIAFARAARHDGWVGDIYRTEEAIGWATGSPRSAREQGADR